VTVNGKRVNIASYRVKIGDVIAVREKSRNMALVLEAVASAERDFCEYITVDAKGLSGTFVRIPELSEVPYPVKMEPNLVVEFYAS
jgi:small subunit ribosomal protein S4